MRADKIKIIATFIFIFLVIFVNSQTAVIIVNDREPGNDTVKSATLVLKEQLSKAGHTVEVSFKNVSTAFNAIVIVPKRLSKSNQNIPIDNPGSEGFKITCDESKVTIYGNSALALRHAVFTYLESLGFRYYFPNPAWYIIPDKPNLFRKINIVSKPSFDHRRIWYGYGTGSLVADTNYRFWFMANKLGGSLQAVVGHAYDDIVYRNKETFLQHPEWFYPTLQKNVIPPDPKFDLTNESLIQFLIKDVLDRLKKAEEKSKPLKMVTMSPSDGGGTCNTPACQKLGTITDRVYYLINRVAKEVSKKYPGTWISGMAYSEYSAPPTIKLEPNVFVSIATAFNYTKYSTDELIGEWGKKAGKVGIYDYLGLYVWDFDLPGKGQANKVDMVAANVKKYYRLGARGYEAESTPGSINKGLGHYIVSKLLWDINSDVQTIKKEFFQNCFGKAAGLMTALWNEWENYPYDAVRETDLASWIDEVQQAGGIEKDEKVAVRLTHIKMYLHYLFQYNNFRKTKSEADLLSLLTYSYNTMDIGAISGYPALWELGNTSSFPGFLYNDQQAKYRVNQPEFHNPVYINQLITSERAALKKKDNIATVQPARKLKNISSLPPVFTEKRNAVFKGTTVFTGPHYFVCRIIKRGASNFIKLSGGLVTGGGSSMPVTISVFLYRGGIDENEKEKKVIEYQYTARKDTQLISLGNLAAGDYLVKVYDPAKMFRIMFSPAVQYSLIITPQHRFNGYTRFMSFYVPLGTKKFRVFKEIETILISPTGRIIDQSRKGNEEFDVDVLPGEEGAWLVNFLNGHFHIEGIPPYFSMDPSQILVSY